MGLSYFGDYIEEVVLAVHVTVWGKVDVTFYLIPALSNKTPLAATVAIYISCSMKQREQKKTKTRRTKGGTKQRRNIGDSIGIMEKKMEITIYIYIRRRRRGSK